MSETSWSENRELSIYESYCRQNGIRPDYTDEPLPPDALEAVLNGLTFKGSPENVAFLKDQIRQSNNTPVIANLLRSIPQGRTIDLTKPLEHGAGFVSSEDRNIVHLNADTPSDLRVAQSSLTTWNRLLTNADGYNLREFNAARTPAEFVGTFFHEMGHSKEATSIHNFQGQETYYCRNTQTGAVIPFETQKDENGKPVRVFTGTNEAGEAVRFVMEKDETGTLRPFSPERDTATGARQPIDFPAERAPLACVPDKSMNIQQSMFVDKLAESEKFALDQLNLNQRGYLGNPYAQLREQQIRDSLSGKYTGEALDRAVQQHMMADTMQDFMSSPEALKQKFNLTPEQLARIESPKPLQDPRIELIKLYKNKGRNVPYEEWIKDPKVQELGRLAYCKELLFRQAVYNSQAIGNTVATNLENPFGEGNPDLVYGIRDAFQRKYGEALDMNTPGMRMNRRNFQSGDYRAFNPDLSNEAMLRLMENSYREAQDPERNPSGEKASEIFDRKLKRALDHTKKTTANTGEQPQSTAENGDEQPQGRGIAGAFDGNGMDITNSDTPTATPKGRTKEIA